MLKEDAQTSRRSTRDPDGWSAQRRWGFTLLLVIVGWALRWHATRVPYFSDDYMQLGMLAGSYPGEHAWWDLYTFIRADPNELALHRAAGTLPWWTFDDINGSVLRPLSSLTLYLDWQLWPANAVASHLHNLAWWALMLATASRLLFRLLPARVAALALAFMALDHGVSMNVGWVANRATLICATFAFVALTTHVERRNAGLNGVGPWTLVSLSLALLGGEYGLVAFAYLFALECFTRDATLSTRLGRLWPALLPLAGYLAWHVLGNYGTFGEAVYAHPLRAPLAYLDWLGSRLPRAIADLLVSLPAAPGEVLSRPHFRWVGLSDLDGLGWIPDGEWNDSLFAFMRVHTIVALCLALVSLVMMRRALLSDSATAPIAAPRPVAALALGATLGLLPVLVAPADARTFTLSQLGAASLVATFVWQTIDALRDAQTRGPKLLPSALFTAWLLVVHLLADPAYSHRFIRELEETHQPVVSSLESLAEDEALEGRDVIVLAAASHTAAVHGGIVTSLAAGEAPRRWHVVSMSSSALTIQRVDARTLIVIPTGAPLLGSPGENFFRPESAPIERGQRFSSGPFEVEVLSKAKQPNGAESPVSVKSVRLHFESSLDDANYLFLTTDGESGRLTRVGIPPAPRMLRVGRPRPEAERD